jgi:S-DNA-T family DNA segregation ATPase FtsK/SpoIIIE
MAYHQARGRDPLIDSSVQETLERRGVELLGIAMMIIGVLAALIIYSYSPSDPGPFSATDAPVQNLLGIMGATIASPVFLILGWGSWSLVALFVVWGARMVLHKGSDRATSRAIFAPVGIALVAVYAATLVPDATWTHSFGLGGLFGDTVVGFLLMAVPMNAKIAIVLLSVLSAVLMLVVGAFVLGFDKEELRSIARFLYVSVIMTYAHIMTLAGRATEQAVAKVKDVQQNSQARREARLHAQTKLIEEPTSDAFVQEPPEKPSLLARMPKLIKRQEVLPEPELVETTCHVEASVPGEDRIRSRIADAIKHRMIPDPAPTPVEEEMPLTKGLGRGPDALVLDGDEPLEPHKRVEPRLTMTSRVSEQSEQAPLDLSDHEVSQDAFDTFQDEIDEPVDMSYRGQVFEPKKVVQPATRKPIQKSVRALAEAQPALKFDDRQAEYELPPLSLLMNPTSISRHVLSDEALEENARLLESVLDDYGVKGEIVSVRPGPVVTMYELEPAPGLKASRVIGLADDIARSMSALSARVSTVPGRSVIGIELPNENREKVVLREILSSRSFGDGNQKLPLALGKDIGGEPMVANLAKMPHLLIAGTTGSGKSVAINTMILSLLYKLTPEECRLIMIDPKMLELSVYDGIPHLLSPVVTDPKKAVVALKWVVGEMEERYRKMSKMGVRNIDGYNSRVNDALSKGEMFSRTIQTGFDDETGDPVFETEEFQPEKMPYIVVIVDEMADLMMVAGKEIEACIQRLAQMARASGIHLIMATQRPSVDVITGTIKANFPTRISFQVTSKIDSRTILGEMGAEQLLGMGDMLYMAGGSKITRCHGPFVSDEEVEDIVNHLKAYGPPEYKSGVVEGPEDDKADGIDMVLGLGGNTEGEDALYDQAVAIVLKDRKVSTSYVQRKLAIGYNKAARLVEQMEDEGLISAANHVGKREILVPEQQ